MAGTNDFKAFATDTDANVTSQEEWEALTALKKGFSSGKASSAQVSKALRQPSTMAAVLGQFIANAELDALDDGDVDGLVAKLATAITTNLHLGEAAKLDAPTGNLVTSGNATFPLAGNKKLIIQWGRVSPPSPGSSTAVSFSATFNVLLGLGMALNGTSGTTGCAGATASNITNSGFNWTMLPGASYGALASSYWIAAGM
ncbi:TPA: phage tail protein [Escherichia coli]|nr:phage tail protein [Escherichia coli]